MARESPLCAPSTSHSVSICSLSLFIPSKGRREPTGGSFLLFFKPYELFNSYFTHFPLKEKLHYDLAVIKNEGRRRHEKADCILPDLSVRDHTCYVYEQP